MSKGSALGRFVEELSCYEKALAINPGHPEALHRKEFILNNLHRFAEAISL